MEETAKIPVLESKNVQNRQVGSGLQWQLVLGFQGFYVSSRLNYTI